MKKMLIIPLLALSLFACGNDESEMQNTINNYMNRPISTQFKTPIMSKNKKVACVSYAVKSHTGKDSEWVVAMLTKADSPSWQVQDIDMDRTKVDACVDTLKRLDQIQLN